MSIQNKNSNYSGKLNEQSTLMSQGAAAQPPPRKYALGNNHNEMEIYDKTLSSSLKSILDSQVKEKQLRNMHSKG